MKIQFRTFLIGIVLKFIFLNWNNRIFQNLFLENLPIIYSYFGKAHINELFSNGTICQNLFLERWRNLVDGYSLVFNRMNAFALWCRQQLLPLLSLKCVTNVSYLALPHRALIAHIRCLKACEMFIKRNWWCHQITNWDTSVYFVDLGIWNFRLSLRGISGSERLPQLPHIWIKGYLHIIFWLSTTFDHERIPLYGLR